MDEEGGAQPLPQATEAPGAVTLADLQAVDFQAVVEGADVIDCFSLSNIFSASAKDAREAGDEQRFRVLRFLAAICSFHLKPSDRAEPFGPMAVFGENRSPIPADYTDEIKTLASIVEDVRHPGLRARLADVVWFNRRRDGRAAQIALDAYADCVEGTLAGTYKTRFPKRSEVALETLDLLLRALQIASMTRKRSEVPERLNTLVRTVVDIGREEQDGFTFRKGAELALRFDAVDPATIATRAEALVAAKSHDDPHKIRLLLHLAAQAHQKAGDEAASRRCRLEAAEQLVRLAEMRGGIAMVASSFLMDAIQELRRIKGTKERRKELEAKLREAQVDAMEELSSFGHPIDLTDLASGTVKAFEGVTLPDALAALATLCWSPEPGALRKEALESLKHAPLASMFAATMLDSEGKVVSRVPGFSGHGEPSDEWYLHKIAHAEGLRREIVVKGQFEPARQFLGCRFPFVERHFDPISHQSPFVPPGHEHLFSLGFARLIQGDYASAVHLLVPRLEPALRYVLNCQGYDASMIQSDMVQEDRSLAPLLEDKRAALEAIFGAAIVFEIDLLFNNRAGPALRHELAHGKLTAGHCYGANCIYAAWFLYHLAAVPLLGHWAEHVAPHLEAEAF